MVSHAGCATAHHLLPLVQISEDKCFKLTFFCSGKKQWTRISRIARIRMSGQICEIGVIRVRICPLLRDLMRGRAKTQPNLSVRLRRTCRKKEDEDVFLWVAMPQGGSGHSRGRLCHNRNREHGRAAGEGNHQVQWRRSLCSRSVRMAFALGSVAMFWVSGPPLGRW